MNACGISLDAHDENEKIPEKDVNRSSHFDQSRCGSGTRASLFGSAPLMLSCDRL